jgi:hypothetical protein
MAAGSGGNPAIAQMARSVIDNLSSRGQGPSQTGGSDGQAPDMAKDALSSRLNELQGADPAVIMRTLKQMKDQAIALFPQTAYAVPGVTKHLSKVLQSLDGALKEAEQAISTQQSIQSVPIGMGAAQPQPDQGGGPQGGSPFMPGR